MAKEFFPAINKQFKELLDKSNNILVLTHYKPDADALGSILSMYQLLIKMGKKKVTAVCSDPVPKMYQFLPDVKELMDSFSIVKDFIITLDTAEVPFEKVRYNIEGNKVNIIVVPKEGEFKPGMVSFSEGKTNFDLIIVLDTATEGKLGPIYDDHKEMFEKVTTVAVDHHISNSKFCDYNYIDAQASSTCEMLSTFLKNYELDDFIDSDIATCLLTGIIGDTNGFKNSNTTAHSFNIASWLVQKQAKQQEIIKNIFKSQSFTSLKLWGRILSNLKYEKDTKLVRAVISKQDFVETDTSEEDKGEIIDELMTNVTEGDVVLLITEKADGLISCSLRNTNDKVDLNKLASTFGGGGHVKAAGFTVKDMNLETATDYILNGIRNYIIDPRKNNTATKQVVDNVPTIEQVDNIKDEIKKEEPIKQTVAQTIARPETEAVKEAVSPIKPKQEKQEEIKQPVEVTKEETVAEQLEKKPEPIVVDNKTEAAKPVNTQEEKKESEQKEEGDNLNLKYPEIKNVKDKFHSEDDEMLFIDESGN